MSSVPQLTKLQFDFSSDRHLICVESNGLETVYTRLKELKHFPEHLQILQLGETAVELVKNSRWEYFQRNFERNDLKLEQFKSVENLIVRFNSQITRNSYLRLHGNEVLCSWFGTICRKS